MAHSHVLIGPAVQPARPLVRRIGPGDLKEALVKGLDDFAAFPTHAVFLCLIYPIVGVLLGRLAIGYDVMPLIYPLAAGFALLGPFAAIGLYELSRRREQGLDAYWTHAFDVFRSPSFGAIAALGGLLCIIFLVWMAVAQAIYVATFGDGTVPSVAEFLLRVFTTREGWLLIVLGNGVGFLFAVLALTISVVSFPLLLDRDVGTAVAVLTSVRAVLANPGTMALWGLIVAGLLLLGTLPFFIGLTVAVPVLGHSTWHLYRKAVEPERNPPQFRSRSASPPRYAADFPAVLLEWLRKSWR